MLRSSTRARLLCFILLVMAFPAINYFMNIIESSALYGVSCAPRPRFSWRTLWNGSWQADMERHLNDSVGFRPDMVRTVNQLNFSCFGKVTNGNVAVGENNNLFYRDYIASYCGADYLGDNFPVLPLVKLKKVQDTLEKLGKTFVLVHSGSKASYFACEIPPYLRCGIPGKTNLSNYLRIGDSLGLHQLDFNGWFASLYGKYPHHLFNRQGLHWNMYGAVLAVDSLISYIEAARGITMPHPHVKGIDLSRKARLQEDDAEVILNLIFPVDTTTYWYPQLEYEQAQGMQKPMVIYIGDSFTWPLVHDGIFNSNTNPEYWFYGSVAVFDDYNKGGAYRDLDKFAWQDSLKKADCVVMMYTSPRIIMSSNEVIDRLYSLFYPITEH